MKFFQVFKACGEPMLNFSIDRYIANPSIKVRNHFKAKYLEKTHSIIRLHDSF